MQLQDDILCLSKVTATLNCARGILRTTTVADKWKPICKTSLTALSLNKCSPFWNSSDEPFARQEYNLMSSSLSGKLQNAIWS